MTIIKKSKEHGKIYCKKCPNTEIVVYEMDELIIPEYWGNFIIDEVKKHLCPECVKKFTSWFNNYE